MKLAELYAKGTTRITLQAVVSESNQRKTNTSPPRPFISGVLTDGRNYVNFIWWNQAEPPKPKTIFDVVATISEYNGNLQLTIEAMTEAEVQDLNDFSIQYGDRDEVVVKHMVFEMVNTIKDPELRKMIELIFERFGTKILSASSSKQAHHAGIFGNVIHSLEVAALSMDIANYYNQFLDIPINVDLCIVGSLLHDFGKIEAYQIEGPLIEMTIEGQITGHITLGIELLEEFRPFWPGNSWSMVQHIILSHHGSLDYGSPVTPRCIEAHIVHMADELSALIGAIDTAHKDLKPDVAMTPKIFFAHNMPHLTQWEVDRKMKGGN